MNASLGHSLAIGRYPKHYVVLIKLNLPCKRVIRKRVDLSDLPVRLSLRMCSHCTISGHICCRPTRMDTPFANSLCRNERNLCPAGSSVADRFCCCWSSQRCPHCSYNHRSNLRATNETTIYCVQLCKIASHSIWLFCHIYRFNRCVYSGHLFQTSCLLYIYFRQFCGVSYLTKTCSIHVWMFFHKEMTIRAMDHA